MTKDIQNQKTSYSQMLSELMIQSQMLRDMHLGNLLADTLTKNLFQFLTHIFTCFALIRLIGTSKIASTSPSASFQIASVSIATSPVTFSDSRDNLL